MFFALSLILAFAFLGLFIYKSELFHASKDSLNHYKSHSEDLSIYDDESIANSDDVKKNQSLEVNLEVHEAQEVKRWKLKQQLNALDYLSQMELMHFKDQNNFEEDINHKKFMKRILRKRITELTGDLKKHNSKKQADKKIG